MLGVFLRRQNSAKKNKKKLKKKLKLKLPRKKGREKIHSAPLLDPADDDSVISSINPASFQDLKEKGIVSAGMIPKLENALKAISAGVSVVRLCHADNLQKADIGTKISA